jgi:hypothetical protein
MPPVGVSVAPLNATPATISYSGTANGAPPSAVMADATDSNGNAKTLQIPVTLVAGTPGSIQVVGPAVTTPATLTGLTATTTAGAVTFSATDSASNTISYAESNLPSGLVSGSPLTYVGGTAPGTYPGVVVTATDVNGAVQKGTFSLTVDASDVYTVGSGGDEVNPSGKGSMCTSSTGTRARLSSGGPRQRPTPRRTSISFVAPTRVRSSSSTRPSERRPGSVCQIPAAAGNPIRCATV